MTMATFSDAPEGSPFYDAIEAINAAGIMRGQTLPDGTRNFRPFANITRGEVAQLLMNMGAPAALLLVPHPRGKPGSSSPSEVVL